MSDKSMVDQLSELANQYHPTYAADIVCSKCSILSGVSHGDMQWRADESAAQAAARAGWIVANGRPVCSNCKGKEDDSSFGRREDETLPITREEMFIEAQANMVGDVKGSMQYVMGMARLIHSCFPDDSSAVKVFAELWDISEAEARKVVDENYVIELEHHKSSE